jgi:hypothetical protein
MKKAFFKHSVRMALVFIFTIWALHVLCSLSFAAGRASVVIEDIRINPATVAPGEHPDITANIRTSSSKSLQVAIIEVLTRPDRIVKSWVRKKVVIAPGGKKSILLPKDYDTKLAGVYKVEFVIYSTDMRLRIHGLSRTFTVAETAVLRPAEKQRERKEQEQKLSLAQERTSLGIGVYGNSLNPAGGATIMLWPFRNVGLQGIYTVGVFTSYEGRLLVKIENQSGFNPYLGAGFLHVSKKANIIGVDTTFEDSKVSGVAGVEVLLSSRLRGYAEVSGSGIKLEKDVTSGALTSHATVKYAPVTFGLGLVISVF